MIRQVSIVTGFLGAGKTTLALGLIQSGAMRDVVLIVNDFGEASFDSIQIGSTGASYQAMDGGCICCSVKDDLLKTLHEIPRLFPDKKKVWIETSGISDPADLVTLFESSSFLYESYVLNSVVCVVDARNNFDWLMTQDSAPQQLAAASCVVVNKYNLPDKAVDTLVMEVGSLNPVADIHVVSLRDDQPISVDIFFGSVAYQIRGTGDYLSTNNHAHETHGFTTHTIRWDGSVDESLFSDLLDAWIESPELDLLRLKGSVHTNNSDRLMVVQGVRKQVTFDYDDLEWPQASVLVVIGREITQIMIDDLHQQILTAQSEKQVEAEICQK
ncbi:MAG: GTP-binding protein [Gammaproteobacteria bacterium]